MTATALLLAVVIVGYLFFAGSSPYHVHLSFESASQLVVGDQIEVGGIPVGSIDSITLSNGGLAQIDASITDSRLTPLHQGTHAEIRSASLSGVANRYIALTPGPNNDPPIADGGSIPASDATAEVDLDQVLNTLTPTTLHDLQQFVDGSAAAFGGRARQFGSALATLDPALSQGDALTRQIVGDQRTFSRFLLESAAVVSAVASRQGDLAALVPATRTTLDSLAARDASLDSLLRRLPPTLNQTNTTLAGLRSTLIAADPAVRAAQPVARPLAVFLDRLGPVAQRGLPVVRALRNTIKNPSGNDLLDVLAGAPPLEQLAVPAFGSAVATVNAALPIVNNIRPYTPDLVAGLANGFGGSTSGYYDANGHYTRISLQSGAYSLNGLGSFAAKTAPTIPGITGYSRADTSRCPGSATQPVPDHSNPIALPFCSLQETP